MKKKICVEVRNKANTAFLLLKVDVATNQLPVSKVQLPTASAVVVSSGSFKQDLQDGIKKKCTLMLRDIVLKNAAHLNINELEVHHHPHPLTW